MAIRAGYNSNIVATGRPFELGQFGISAGAAFYHKSGLFVDASGYWSNEYDPAYFLTVASVGYMKTGFKGWSWLVEYSRYFYNLSDQYASVSYTNNFTSTTLFEHKLLNLRFDYSLYTGEKTGHRFTPTVSLNFEKRNWRGIRKISLYPSVSTMFGIEQVRYFRPLFRNRLERIFRDNNNLPLYTEEFTNEFGIMNYAFNAPLSVFYKNWGFLMSYTYNIPRRLTYEETNLTNSGYLSFSVVRYFDVGTN